MKRSFINLTLLVVALFTLTSFSYGQGRAKTGPDPSTIRDAELEKDSLHNLEVARHYFKLKKAYLAALKRCEEIDAGNPTFSKMDEVLYIAGQSSLKLADTGGKQKAKSTLPSDIQARERQATKHKAPEELREDARMYFSRLVAGYPTSSFAKQVESELQALGGPIKLDENKP